MMTRVPTYAADLDTAKADAERCAARWGGEWGVAPNPFFPGKFTRALVGNLPSEACFVVSVALTGQTFRREQ